MYVFSDRAFSHRPRPDPAPEDLRIPDRARLLRKKRAAAPRAGEGRPAPDLIYPYFFRNRMACWISVFHLGPFTVMPAASPGVISSVPSLIPSCGRTWL